MANGGIIPPDGRQPAPKGVGRNARRHDLERPKTPGLAGSDLQYGDVSRLQQAQRTAPTGTSAKQVQQPAQQGRASARPARTQTGPSGMSIPDPMAFLTGKLGNTLQGGPSSRRLRAIDPTPWIPMLKSLANSPGSSGTLQNAVVNQLSTLVSRPYVPDIYTADMQDLDDGVEEMVNILEAR